MKKNDGWTIKYGRLAKVYGRQEHEQWIAEKSKNKTKQIRLLEEQKAKLKEQLKEARYTIYCIANTDGSDCKTILETIIRDANEYLEKLGVK